MSACVMALAMRRDEPELIQCGKKQMGSRLMNAKKLSSDFKDVGGAHVVTGGLGGLGLLTGRWLASQGATSVVLVSRSGWMRRSGAFERSLLEQALADVHKRHALLVEHVLPTEKKPTKSPRKKVAREGVGSQRD